MNTTIPLILLMAYDARAKHNTDVSHVEGWEETHELARSFMGFNQYPSRQVYFLGDMDQV